MRFASPFSVLLVLCCLLPGRADAERTLVLITDAACGMQEISTLDIRKAYLGVTVSYDGRAIRPLRLNNDRRLKQVFLQSVVAMSEKSYERRLLSLALKYGTPRPLEFDSPADLIAALKSRRCSVAYVWQEDVEARDGLTVLKVLWQGD